MISSRALLYLSALALNFLIVGVPCFFLLFESNIEATEVPVRVSSTLLTTFCWSIAIGVTSTAIGWWAGSRLSSTSSNSFWSMSILFIVSLAVPSYAVYFAWWQLWPSGSWLHQWIVSNEYTVLAMQVCLFLSLTSWSWPIAALFSAFKNRRNQSTNLLSQIDFPSLTIRIFMAIKSDTKYLIGSVLFIGALTASNTVCFDLAQVSTLGNELRAIVVSGGNFFSSPLLTFAGISVGILAITTLFFCRPDDENNQKMQNDSLTPVICFWFLMTGFPLFLSGLYPIIFGDGFQLWDQYRGDLLLSLYIAFAVAISVGFIAISFFAMFISNSFKLRFLANLLLLFWLLMACIPSSLLSSVFQQSWNSINISFITNSYALLIFGLIAKIGFVGILGAKWMSSVKGTSQLARLDYWQTIPQFCHAFSPQLVQLCSISGAIALIMSFSDISLATQLSPPSNDQPVTIALLHAMHYQRPQIVTSALSIILAVAIVSGLFIYVIQRKFLAFSLLACMILGCNYEEKTPVSNIRSIGKVGYSNGSFVTPRAIDSNSEIIIVVDKSGRIQRFNHEGTFLSSWTLDLSGTGYPTGVSVDQSGLIWIADTHQYRILVLNQNGEEVLSFGSYGKGDGEFLYTTDIAFGNNGEVYVSEYGGNDRISVFNRSGEFQYSFGHHGSDNLGFKRPQSIAVDHKTGNLYVADSGNHRVVILNSRGDFLSTIGEVGRKEKQLLYPYGIMIDTNNNLVICEYGNNRLQSFSLQGDFLKTFGSAGNELGFFQTPWGVAKIGKGIVVADTGNNRLQVLPDMMAQ